MPTSETQELLLSAWKGDVAARDRLCRHYMARVAAYVSRQMGARARRFADRDAIANGVLDETMRALFRLEGAPTLQGFEQMLFRRAGWRVKNEVRRHERDVGESAVPEHRPPSGAEPATSGPVTRADTRRWLTELILRLPERYRAVVRLRALEGLSNQEVAASLGLTADVARKRYERATEALRRRLHDRNDD